MQRNRALTLLSLAAPSQLRSARRLIMAVLVLIALTPGLSWACACGCGVFEVGTASLLPHSAGGTVWLEYDFMDQYLNWHATQIESAGKNNDKVLRTHFMTLGGQYMFNRSWGAMLEVPYWQRFYKGAYSGNNDDIQSYNFNSLGDIRIMGMYTGLSEDMSTGLLGGFKVPSGDWHYPRVDRDTQIGTGSTDLLFGAYHLGRFPSHLGMVPLTFRERPFSWFAQAYYDLPILTQDHYKPGREFDGAVAAYYNFGQVGPLKELAPMLTMLISDRVRDSMSEANPQSSGYTRLLIAPGAEIRLGILRWYSDIELPIFQNMNGDQVTAPFLFKTILSYDF